MKDPQEQKPFIQTAYRNPLRNLAFVASIASGIQFGWALQLSLLTPYVQLLGIPHTCAAFIWLCGPISGMLVQPIVGQRSDHCTSRYGRRRPFIVAGAGLVVLAVFFIAFAADLGYLLGDPLGPAKRKPRAIFLFVLGFWILDVANNMLQGPCRALLADLAGKSPSRTRTANAFYSFFMAVGNVLGFAAGSFTNLHKLLPFAQTLACDTYCANLKSAFFLSIILLLAVTTLSVTSVNEVPFLPAARENPNGHQDEDDAEPFIWEIFTALRDLPRAMRVLLLVTALNWLAWFPFLLFDTDWMGREIYGGEVEGPKADIYHLGVRAGSFGLMFNSVVSGLTALAVEFLGKRLGGAHRLWGFLNILLAICLGFTLVLTRVAESCRKGGGSAVAAIPPVGVRVSAMALFAVMGIPLAVTYSIPFALASISSHSSGAGQGLAMGVLNLSVVIPQIVISTTSGPVDAMFGGGNLPAFVMGAICALASGLIAITMLPSPLPDFPVTRILRT